MWSREASKSNARPTRSPSSSSSTSPPSGSASRSTLPISGSPRGSFRPRRTFGSPWRQSTRRRPRLRRRRCAATLHNAGFLAVERIAEALGARWRATGDAFLGTGEIEGRRVVLAKPATFLNLSGDAVAPLYRKHADGPGDRVVLH